MHGAYAMHDFPVHLKLPIPASQLFSRCWVYAHRMEMPKYVLKLGSKAVDDDTNNIHFKR